MADAQPLKAALASKVEFVSIQLDTAPVRLSKKHIRPVV